MEETDSVVQIFSEVPEMSCNFLIKGKCTSGITSNYILEALEYWRRYKRKIIDNLSLQEDKFMSPSNIEFRNRVKFAKVTSIHIIEITPI